MKILMIANFVTLPWEGGNSRFTYILEKLDCKNNNVEFITSRFRHGTKKNRELPEEEIKKLDYKLTLINEPGYKKNVSIKRFNSHKILAKNIKKYLDKKDEKPDVIYCAVPSLDVAKVVTQYAKKNNIRLIIDIQDLWPEAFEMVFNIPIISNMIFYPMKRQANYIYSNADEIVAVSDTYVNRALKVNKKVKEGLSVFLGTDLNAFDKYKEENKIEFKDDLIRLAYIGTLGHSYDIKSIIDAIKILNDKGINNIKFIIMGDGPLRNEFEKYAKEKNINCEFTGKLEYNKMVGILCACDIAVNPIVGKSAASIINKVGDYAAAGLPVINMQNSEEYRDLLEKYNAGLNCENGSIEDIAKKLEKLILDKELRKQLGKNNRFMAEEKFDRNESYINIIKFFEEKKVSIIVPIYNTSKYLRRCINSIINQIYKNLEIILIDDGSTDSSFKICLEYLKKDSRIISRHKENTGQADTRNLGLEMATGDYISFVDSDDWIDNKMISTLVNNLEKNKADVSVCSLKLFKDGDTIDSKIQEKPYIEKIDLSEIYKQSSKKGYGSSVCNKLYKREIIQGVRFGNTNIAEDSNFNKKIYKKNPNIIFQASEYYHYYSREDSTIHGEFKINEYKNLLLNEKCIIHTSKKREKRYYKARISIAASKVIVGIISSNGDKDNSMLNHCFELIKNNIIYTIFSLDITLVKKLFAVFCLINRRIFLGRNNKIVTLCCEIRKKIG